MNGSPETSSSASRSVMFADLADSTRLIRELGDEGARQVAERALGLARGVVEAETGRVVKTIGDELMCLFPDGDSRSRRRRGSRW